MDKIPIMRPTNDVELYVQGLENDLQQATIPRDCWKFTLTTRLTPVLKDLVSDLQVDHTADFEDGKARLLNCVGQTSTQAGQRVLQLRPVDIKTKSTALVMQQIQRLFYRATKEARTKDEVVTRLTVAKIQSLLSPRGHQFPDGRRVANFQELREALQSWEATEGSLFGDDHPRMKWQQQRST